jgi:beta-glucosidase
MMVARFCAYDRRRPSPRSAQVALFVARGFTAPFKKEEHMQNQTQDPAGRRFPEGFVWGAATASYQIEGAAREDGRSESIWDRFSHTPGKTVNGDTGDVACDHYHRWRDDIRLMRDLGLGAYRFSIAWPRILPEGRGRVNQAGLDFYDRLVDGLLEAGITPWATLYHWDMPQVLEDAGGWPNRATAAAFAEYADAITRRLGDRVKHWITLNEPWCSSFLSYHIGEHAPGRKSFPDAVAAVHTLLLAHGLSVPIIRGNSPGAQVGITLNLSQAYPATDSEADKAAAHRYDGYFNRWFLDPLYGRGYPADMLAIYGDMAPRTEPADFDAIAAPTDFLGLNYYNPTFIRDDPSETGLGIAPVRLDGHEYTAMDWVVYPQGLYDQLLRVPRDYPTGPLYITENGAAYDDAPPQQEGGEQRVHDPRRTSYYALHLDAALRAIEAGSPLKGYFAWSLMDNFEWAWGYTRRFGITYVDYETQQRTLKDSARWYREVIAANGLVE